MLLRIALSLNLTVEQIVEYGFQMLLREEK